MISDKLIRFLGTGTSVGIPMIGCRCKVCMSTHEKDKRLRTAAFIQYKDISILIDIGPDFRYQMLKHQIDDFTAIFITHDHRDHVAGLDDLRALNFTHDKKYPIYCSQTTFEGIKDQFGFIFNNHTYTSKAQFDIHIIDHKTPFKIADETIIPLEVLHGNQKVLGCRMGDLTYITDASSIEASEIEKIKGTKILVLNALRKEVHPTHFTLSQAIAVAELIEPEQTYFTHISHHLGLHHAIQKSLPPNMFLAYDGLEVAF